MPRCRCVFVPMPCSRCEGATDGPSRTLCARCRSEAKFEYLQAQRGEGGSHVIMQIHGRTFAGMSPGSTVPKCFTCGAPSTGQPPGFQPTRILGVAVCERCAISLSMPQIQAAIDRREELGQAPGCNCERCFGVSKANWKPGGCPQCEGWIGPNGGCESCMYQGNVPPGRFQVVSSFRTPSHQAAIGTTMFHGQFHTGGIVSGGTMGYIGIGRSNHGPPALLPAETREPFSMEEPDGDRSPDLIEHVLAWRGWNITPDGHLVAAATDGIWDAGVNRAVCHGGPNHTDVPAVGCHCGFYGWHAPEQIQHGSIHGAIKCWGEFVVHDVGVRAEYAEIVAIVAGEEVEAEPLARVVDRYKVPVLETIEKAAEFAADKGVVVPEDMRPEPTGEGLTFQQAAANLSVMVNGGGQPAAQAMQKFGQAVAQVNLQCSMTAKQMAALEGDLEKLSPKHFRRTKLALAKIAANVEAALNRFGL